MSEPQHPEVVRIAQDLIRFDTSNFGGGMGAAAQGSTVVEKNLSRATVVAALIFTITTLSLGMLMTITS